MVGTGQFRRIVPGPLSTCDRSQREILHDTHCNFRTLGIPSHRPAPFAVRAQCAAASVCAKTAVEELAMKIAMRARSFRSVLHTEQHP